MSSPSDRDAWQNCPVCRQRPISVQVDVDGLPAILPRGWRAIADRPGFGSWTRDILVCVECETRWLIFHDAAIGLLEATAPLPSSVEPLLHPETPLLTALPLLRRADRGHTAGWMHERVDALSVAWFASAPLNIAAAAMGVLHIAVEPGRSPWERHTALCALLAVIQRAVASGEVLGGAWLGQLSDPLLRTSGPSVLAAMRAVLRAGLEKSATLAPPPALRTCLLGLLDTDTSADALADDVSSHIRQAFADRWR